MEITHYCIEKLNGIYNYDIPIVDNKLVLVGENGTGKSTLLSILNCILSRQWHKLVDYDFKSVAIILNNETYKFTIRELKEYQLIEKDRGLEKVEHYVKRIIKSENIDINALYENEDVKRELIRQISYKTPINITMKGLERVISGLYEEQEIFSKNNVSQLDKAVKRIVTCPIIYLPTYRRIERELSSIFPSLEKKNYHERDYYLKGSSENEYQIELVEFGMRDVKEIMKTSLDSLEHSFRTGIKKLMADYLQDIFMHRHESFEYSSLGSIESSELEKMLVRIDAETLSGDIKETIKNNILKLGNESSKDISESDKVISYFISKLIEFHAEQSKKESLIKSYISACNKYLVAKKLQFNAIEVDIKIFHTDESDNIVSNKDIPFESLSSGEKQIVSLFSHLYLSKRKEYVIIIDEPELSLSVKWQRTFLEDIVSSGTCLGLFSVTHSPFVYENTLDKYAHAIGEFMERSL